ncbi:MAG: ATP-binding protein [Fuerstiella sp.]|nr:ATP-binding protein [Fuerstiella sp.]
MEQSDPIAAQSADDLTITGIATELRAESITLRIRWFGLCVGYILVNFGGLLNESASRSPQALNAILTLGAVYAVIDTWWSARGKVFLSEFRLAVSAMEALFIGLLCFFDDGVLSPFRFYYFLSLLVCAIRHTPALTFSTFGMHAVSYCVLGLTATKTTQETWVTLALTVLFLGWASWAINALTGLLKSAGERLETLNLELRDNQATLESRISERTQALQESQARMVQQEKQAAFGLLAAGIAHEVGNPLASISSIVQMLNRRSQDDYTAGRLHMVDAQLRRIQKILRELVGFSRPANQDVTSVDVHAVISDALNIAKYYKRWKGKKVVTQFSPGMPILRTVYDQLVQLVLNLVLNALDATDEGATITVSTDVLADDEEVAITISDQGHGIPLDVQRQVFNAYFTTKSTGTGLGLFVCRQLAETELGGSIDLVRSDSTGTIFRIRLPL